MEKAGFREIRRYARRSQLSMRPINHAGGIKAQISTMLGFVMSTALDRTNIVVAVK
jgi:hypothetical protein